MALKDKRILITGGNSGLGYEVAKLLVGEKADVMILGKDKRKLEDAAGSLNIRKDRVFLCDLRNFDDVNRVSKKLNEIDVLINCAGIINYESLEDHSEKRIREIIETNLIGTIFITQALIPIMKKRQRGLIINVSSTSGLVGGGHQKQSVYIASKFGVTGFTEALKKDLAETGVKVYGFYPGGMDTKLFEKAGLDRDTSKFMSPADVAEVLVFMIKKSDVINMDHVVVNRNK